MPNSHHVTVDPTESVRRKMVETINSNPCERQELGKIHGRIWDTEELRKDFEVVAFLAPYVTVKRKSDGALGTMMFQHAPRFYYSCQELR